MPATFIYTDSQNTIFDVPLISASAIIVDPPVNTNFVYTTNQINNVYNGFTSVTRYTPNRYLVTNEQGYPVVTNIAPSSTVGVTGATGQKGETGASGSSNTITENYLSIANQVLFTIVNRASKVEVSRNGVLLSPAQYTLAANGLSVTISTPSAFANQIMQIIITPFYSTTVPLPSTPSRVFTPEFTTEFT